MGKWKLGWMVVASEVASEEQHAGPASPHAACCPPRHLPSPRPLPIPMLSSPKLLVTLSHPRARHLIFHVHTFALQEGLVPGVQRLTDEDLAVMKEINLGQNVVPGSPNAKVGVQGGGERAFEHRAVRTVGRR